MMTQYDDALLETDGEDSESDDGAQYPTTCYYSAPYPQKPPLMLLPPESGVNVEEDVLLNCPHCHKNILYSTTNRFPSLQTTTRKWLPRTGATTYGFFKGSAKGSTKTFKELFCSGGGGRQCSVLLLAVLTIFLICSYVLNMESVDFSSTKGSRKNYQTRRISDDHSGGESWVTESSEVTETKLKTKRLPQCIIIGARKCGTRALIDMLNLHPQVEKAAVEVHFFDRDDNYGKGLDWYREHMPETTEDQLSIEKSPSYFVTPEVPERVAGMNSSIKLFLIVREPVTRVISDYTQIYGTNSKLHNSSRRSHLEELVLHPDGSVNVHYKAIRISLYSRYLQRWLDVFPPSQIHVIDGDALIKDPYSQLKEAERFLGLQPRLQRDNFYFNATKGFFCWRKLESTTMSMSTLESGETIGQGHKNDTTTTSLHCLNDSKGRPHPQVEPHIVSKLRRFYHPHNLRFYDMVGRDFGWPEK